MEIHLHGDDVKITPELTEYTRKKLSRLDRYLPNIADVRVDFARQHTRRGEMLTAQITIHHSRGAILRAEQSSSGDAEAALNAAVTHMYHRIERFKGKQDPRRARDKFSATLEELESAEALPEREAVTEPVEASDPYLIARRKDVPVTSMTEEEAVEQMELLGHTFFMFFNADREAINIVYKRKSGGYGVLNPTMN